MKIADEIKEEDENETAQSMRISDDKDKISNGSFENPDSDSVGRSSVSESLASPQLKKTISKNKPVEAKKDVCDKCGQSWKKLMKGDEGESSSSIFTSSEPGSPLKSPSKLSNNSLGSLAAFKLKMKGK